MTIIVCAMFGLHVLAQPSGSPQGEIVLYVQDNVSATQLDAAAGLLNSSVLIYPDAGQNIALVEWYGPFTINGQYISNIASVASYLAGDNNEPPVNQQLPEIDGGVENHIIGEGKNPKGDSNGNYTGNCYPSKFPPMDYDHTVNLGIFDTGAEYDLARLHGHRFESVDEINGPISDGNGHGTHVSSIIDRQYHIVSKFQTLNYMIGNPFDDSGTAALAEVIFDVEDALHNYSMQVINLSFSYEGVDDTYDPLKLLMESEDGRETLFVVAAGNDNQSISNSSTNTFLFPAAFSLDNVLTVGAYSCSSLGPQRAGFSNYSNIHVDLFAPGVNILAMDNTGSMVEMSGTSQATAYVSATAALVGSSITPFIPEEVKCIILNNIAPAPLLSNLCVSGGILDIDAAILNTTCTGGTPSNPHQAGFAKEETPQKMSTNIYPVPCRNYMNIDVVLEKEDDIEVKIFSIDGILLKKLNGEAAQGMNEYSITFDEIAFHNQYLVQISTSSTVETKRIVRIE